MNGFDKMKKLADKIHDDKTADLFPGWKYPESSLLNQYGKIVFLESHIVFELKKVIAFAEKKSIEMIEKEYMNSNWGYINSKIGIILQCKEITFPKDSKNVLGLSEKCCTSRNDLFHSWMDVPLNNSKLLGRSNTKTKTEGLISSSDLEKYIAIVEKLRRVLISLNYKLITGNFTQS